MSGTGGRGGSASLTATQKRALLPLLAAYVADGSGGDAAPLSSLDGAALTELRLELGLPYSTNAEMLADTWTPGTGVHPPFRLSVPVLLDVLLMRIVCREDVGGVSSASTKGDARQDYYEHRIQTLRALKQSELDTLLLWHRDRADAADAAARREELQALRHLSSSLTTALLAKVHAPAPLGSDVRFCVLCQESGGELYECGRCHELRHEACGGPHPDDGEGAECRRCRREQQAATPAESLSSLRTSTSTGERASLAEYEERDEDSSLSGFLVADDASSDKEDSESSRRGRGTPPTPRTSSSGGSSVGPQQQRTKKRRRKERRR